MLDKHLDNPILTSTGLFWYHIISIRYIMHVSMLEVASAAYYSSAVSYDCKLFIKSASDRQLSALRK
jgi:hypothetical protein